MRSQLTLPFVDAATRVVPAPIVKWVGGKARLLSQLLPLLPDGAAGRRYFEPFLGGGALFFARRPELALLSDSNAHLCVTYAAIRDDVEAVIERLRELATHHSTERYYECRGRYNRDAVEPVERAALFIYLNKCGYNGLYRVNRRGEYNVPAGRYERPRILDERGLRAASVELRRAELRCADFEEALANARAGDFVYLDPPYVPVSRTSSFTGYAPERFTMRDQQRLRDVFGELDRRGCMVMLSNSAADEVRVLYGSYVIDVVSTQRSISCGRRGRVTELVVRNYGAHHPTPKAAASSGGQLEAWA